MSNLTPGAPENAPSRQASKQTVFRVLGVLILVVALGFLVVAGMDFFGATSSDELGAEPTRLWMFFVGIPLLFVGGVFLQLGFAGAGAKYMAGEHVPVLKESMDQLGFQGNAPSSSGTGPHCRSCGRQNDADARFCSSCGSSMSA